MVGGGLVYSCGAGYHGQLGLGVDRPTALVPELIEALAARHLLFKSISAGSHHCAGISVDGELYTWGSNRQSCLGRDIDELDVEYTALPGHVGGFGALVDGTGQGLVRSVACGTGFTIVSTWPYDGPDEETARLILEEQAAADDEDSIERSSVTGGGYSVAGSTLRGGTAVSVLS